VIAWLVYFSIQKNSESAARSQQCSEKCTPEGNAGYEFQWNILSGPVCRCINDKE